MFVGRIEDLNFLNKQYHANKFSFIPIYGRRRVGKTTLIKEFIQDKKAIYYQALEEREELNIERLSNAVSCVLYPDLPKSAQLFRSYTDIFNAISEYAEKEKIIFIIDEFPYLAKASKSIRSLLQNQIDHHWKDKANIQLILCGSSMSFMERQVLGYKSPLYGRKTGQIKLRPFDFYQTQDYFPTMEKEKVAEIYGITGGIPQYLEQINPEISTINNIRETFLKKTSLLFEEPQNLLKQELDDPSSYNSILSAIAEGRSRLNEIATKVNIPTSNLSRYLENLMDLDIVEKKYPIGEERSKKTIYTIKDSMFRFWFRFIAPNISQIELGITDFVASSIEMQFPHFMGAVFEEISTQYLWKEMRHNNLPTVYRNFGSWWGNNPIERKQEEIDIVGIGFEDEEILLAECKWRNEFVSKSVLETLVKRSSIFAEKTKTLYVFSKTSFTKEAIDYSKKQQLTLIELQTM
ncbi:hypothetical protein SAMN02745116_01625 [Pilibacter termitis]|uniref:DUF234 domain-containing protein n=1 Tax=Pilibacter termitis TaxID=263852 RepID=A0A1T4P322_9ENTE|nr:ATP-binding protein [Pilibacter termitis]SJZ85859.1 hypothetical protein SAMN02745116_01625 [Pilibacter termitis]